MQPEKCCRQEKSAARGILTLRRSIRCGYMAPMFEHVVSIKKVEIDNAVAEAVFLVFGGLREAAVALDISVQGVRNTLTEGQVRTGKNALRWEEATERAGCKIPREELIGWHAWRGPERHPDLTGRGRRDPKGSTPPSLRTAPRPDATPADGPTARVRQRTRRSRSGPIWNTTSAPRRNDATSRERDAA